MPEREWVYGFVQFRLRVHDLGCAYPRSHATLAVVSQGEGDSVADSDPPTYYQTAELPELMLEEGEETVRLLDTDNTPVATGTYRDE